MHAYSNPNYAKLQISPGGRSIDDAIRALESEWYDALDIIADPPTSTMSPFAPNGVFITDKFLDFVTAMGYNHTLQSLTLSNCGLNGSNCAMVAEFANLLLVHLDLTENTIGNDAMVKMADHLFKRESLKVLILDECGIGAVGATAIGNGLGGNSFLFELRLPYNGIGEDGAVAIAGGLENNKGLKSLSLFDCDIGEEGTTAIGRALTTHPTIQHLDLGLNNLGSAGIVEIANMLAKHPSLLQLHLACGSLTPAGGTAIGQALRTNSTLQELNMSQNCLFDEGTTEIANGLVGNPSLTSLTLVRCGVESRGFESIGEMMGVNTVLRAIDLSFNILTHRASVAITRGLIENTSIHSLRIRDVHMDAQCAIRLATALGDSSCIDTLDFSLNQIGDEGVIAMMEALVQNRVILYLSMRECGSPYSSTSSNGARAIRNLMKTSDTLQHLIVSHHDWRVGGMREIADGLTLTTSLREFEVTQFDHTDPPRVFSLREVDPLAVVGVGIAIRESPYAQARINFKSGVMSLGKIWSALALPEECAHWTNQQIVNRWADNSREKLLVFGLGRRESKGAPPHGMRLRSGRGKQEWQPTWFLRLGDDMFRVVGRAFWGRL
jgi:Ran GTPase-activating protein (RanGAP) involved in mRNA processing and transport